MGLACSTGGWLAIYNEAKGRVACGDWRGPRCVQHGWGLTGNIHGLRSALLVAMGCGACFCFIHGCLNRFMYSRGTCCLWQWAWELLASCTGNLSQQKRAPLVAMGVGLAFFTGGLVAAHRHTAEERVAFGKGSDLAWGIQTGGW